MGAPDARSHVFHACPVVVLIELDRQPLETCVEAVACFAQRKLGAGGTGV